MQTCVMEFLCIILFPFLLIGFNSTDNISFNKSDKGLVAFYHFDEGSGQSVSDSSGKNNGLIYGEAIWVNGIEDKALMFDGSNRIEIRPSSQLNLTDKASITAWVKGRGGSFKLTELREETTGNPSKRGPHFQVCGDKIYFALNSDQVDMTTSGRVDHDLWIGTADISLTRWKDKKRAESPLSYVEPKLQVVGQKTYYEYFGQDRNRVMQIWTANSNIDGTNWEPIQRTNQKESYRVEQGNIQVKTDEIYYGYTKKDERDVWQLWTASSNLDGSNWKSVQRTIDGGWYPNFQVVGDKIYYVYSRLNPSNKMYFAESNIDGKDWKIIKTLDGDFIPYVFFQVDKHKLYFSYSQFDESKLAHLWTGRMSTDGTGLQVTQRTFGNSYAYNGGIQVLGENVNYVFLVVKTNKPESEWDLGKYGKLGITYWTSQSDLDGLNWKALQRTFGPQDISWAYKQLQIVGGKTYYGAEARYSRSETRAMLGVSGSNIINKGDAYGIGVTEDNEARGFINGGQDYLFRAEAPSDTAGAIAYYLIDNNWHFLAMTYDGKKLNLYIDGGIKASATYDYPIGSNPFPLIIGDGFQGVIDEIGIYDRTLHPEEVSALFQEYQQSQSSMKR